MSEFIPNERLDTVDLEKTGYMLDLLGSNLIPEETRPQLTIEQYEKYKQEKAKEGINLDFYSYQEANKRYLKSTDDKGIFQESAYNKSIEDNGEELVRVNKFDDNYNSQHGLDTISYNPKLKKKRYSEETYPASTTHYGTLKGLQKLANYYIEDANHEGLWTFVNSNMESITFAMKVILAYENAQIIETGYSSDEYFHRCHINSLLNKNWLDKQPLIEIKSKNEVHYQEHLAENKRRLKHNKEVDKINKAVDLLRQMRTYKELKTEVLELLKIRKPLTANQKELNDYILGKLRTKRDKITNNITTKRQRKKSLLQIENSDSDCEVLGSPHAFFSQGNGVWRLVKRG